MVDHHWSLDRIERSGRGKGYSQGIGKQELHCLLLLDAVSPLDRCPRDQRIAVDSRGAGQAAQAGAGGSRTGR